MIMLVNDAGSPRKDLSLTNTKRAGKKKNNTRRGMRYEDEIGGGQIKIYTNCDQHSKTGSKKRVG